MEVVALDGGVGCGVETKSNLFISDEVVVGDGGFFTVTADFYAKTICDEGICDDGII